MREARRPRRGLTAAVPISSDEVLLAEPALIELADRLRERRTPVEPDVLDAVQSVLTRAESPLHAPTRPGELRAWAYTMLGATDGAATH